MGREATLPKRIETTLEDQPHRDSYDSGYEHSLQHWIDLRELVETQADLS